MFEAEYTLRPVFYHIWKKTSYVG